MNHESPNTFPFPDFASAMPATDRASLEGLSKDEVRAWALRKSEEYRLLSYTMLSVHNAAAPIHTLPVELLMKIFSMTWSPRKGQQGLRPTSVCRRWCTVYLSAPAFWAEAVAELWFKAEHDDEKCWTWGHDQKWLSPEFVTMLLDRSSPHPIALHVHQMPHDGVRDLTLPTYLLPSAVFPHLNHVVSLYTNTTLLHLHDLYQVLDAGMPTLEELFIYARESEPPNLVGTLASLRPVSDESLPRLYTLSLDPPIFFPLIAVQSLKSLHLDSSQDTMSVNGTVPWLHPAGSDSRSLLRLLSRCCNLEYLHLNDFRRSRWWPPLGNGRSESGTVQLPSFKELSFGDETSEPCALAVLAALDPCIPSTALVHFGPLIPDEPDSLSTLMPSFLVQHHPFDTIILSPSGFRFKTWSIRCIAAQSLRLDIQFGSQKTLADLRIEDVFREACVTQLEINQDRDTTPTDPVEDCAAVLRAFPHLTHLTASGVDTPSGVVDALGAIAGHGVTADSDVLASGSPLCPVLRYLTLGWEVPREIGPKGSVEACDPALYRRHQSRCWHPCRTEMFGHAAAVRAPGIHEGTKAACFRILRV
ncbi:hypothetical protein LXA43DRAFT_1109973 [Ganoderma leucocontextum]|nr:hypothetical protein LXA43DRAFT_1109973 [Ganoderma leucocontextum]